MITVPVTDEEYDHVVVGGGTAGCVLAARLSEDPDTTVLLLEDGPTDASHPAVRDARLGSVLSLWGDPAVSRVHRTVPQPGLGGREIDLPQGRVLGGGSSINALLHVRGNPLDFEAWDPDGKDGWSFSDLLPYFRRSEDYRHGADPAGDDADPDCALRGCEGPLRVVGAQAPSAASAAFVRAVAAWPAAGGGATSDYNSRPEPGLGFYYQSARTAANVRSSTAGGYLAPAMGRPNLTVRTGSRAAAIGFEGDRAVTVTYVPERAGGERRVVRARREIIVACGALATPVLLACSGLGPADLLRELGRPVVADLPGVGRNLQDHLLFGVGYRSLQPLADPELLAEAGVFLNSGLGRPDAPPDLQFFFGPVQFVDERYRVEGPGFTIAPVLLHPASRGTVRPAPGGDPFAPPILDPGYLSERSDLDVLVRGLELAREVAHRPELAAFTAQELAPGDAVTDPAELAAYVRRSAGTVWHPVGTCRMGTDPDAADAAAVVGYDLAVHGVRGLRIADASVMPALPSGNTNAVTVALAEKAADLIRAGR